MADFQSLDIRRLSASTQQPPKARTVEEVAKLIDVSRCIGCKACQAACMEWNDLRQPVQECHGNYTNPEDLSPAVWTLMRFTEYENPDGNLEWLIRKDGCMHCSDPGCLKACPSPGAIVQYENGIVDFISENCIGCTYCVKGCPFNIPRINSVDRKVYKCSLCVDRVSVGQAPACAKSCPTAAIMFGTKADMIVQAKNRIVDLNKRGFKNAGLYDPPGVGGTHVMYVLHHADNPRLYANLPENPKISAIVQLWKGGFKIVGLAGLAFAAVGSFFHYVAAGPDEVDSHDENVAYDMAHLDDKEETHAMEVDSTMQREVRQADTGTVYVDRYNATQRINHWITAALFTLLTLSGLSLFHPSLFWLTNLFGGGPNTRAIHPWFGIFLFASFIILFVRFFKLNIPNKDDIRWTIKLGNIVQNKHEGLPELGKYNAGQKMVFWGQSALITVMFVSGILIWDQYFGTYTVTETKRWALAAHSLAALIAILIIIVHIYAGIWIKGTGRAMIRGNVTGGWAYRHHRKWLRKIALGREEAKPGEPGFEDNYHPHATTIGHHHPAE